MLPTTANLRHCFGVGGRAQRRGVERGLHGKLQECTVPGFGRRQRRFRRHGEAHSASRCWHLRASRRRHHLVPATGSRNNTTRLGNVCIFHWIGPAKARKRRAELRANNKRLAASVSSGSSGFSAGRRGRQTSRLGDSAIAACLPWHFLRFCGAAGSGMQLGLSDCNRPSRQHDCGFPIGRGTTTVGTSCR